jgi:Spy/CpxP family protein refolding chaperone
MGLGRLRVLGGLVRRHARGCLRHCDNRLSDRCGAGFGRPGRFQPNPKRDGVAGAVIRCADYFRVPGDSTMKTSIRTLGIIFSVGLNVAFIGSYVYQMLTRRPTFAYEEVRLDSDQRTRMMAGRDRFIASIDAVGNRIIDLHVDLIDAIAADPPDRTAIQAKFDEIRMQQQSMQQVVVEHLLEDKSILRPDQRQQFFGALKQRIRSQGMPGPPWLPRDRKRPAERNGSVPGSIPAR